MKVKLISLTVPMLEDEQLKDMSAEDLIVYTARVSNPSNQDNLNTAPKLLRYLIEHKHWSPFDMVDMTVEIETSRDISAQILRHRSFCFQEYSGRYAKAIGFEHTKPRRQDLKNRQNSIDDLPDDVLGWWSEQEKNIWDIAHQAYENALSKGVAKEVARKLLPIGQQTRLYMKGSVRSWIHYLQVRLDISAQKEHRDVADAIRNIFVKHFPNCAEAACLLLNSQQNQK